MSYPAKRRNRLAIGTVGLAATAAGSVLFGLAFAARYEPVFAAGLAVAACGFLLIGVAIGQATAIVRSGDA